ncbi:RAMP superfamily CRISPR-associated protein [Archaeoglobus neptunius]|uniref:RAMP superfamily CRISPR-associated protein n=1 Tax=Archaeoglobus neptunius TaxID=2798580 RepID=UPI00192704B2|nr:RAMP superfamily CRISPR-associated protein [Archaeoglobus neptunius]
MNKCDFYAWVYRWQHEKKGDKRENEIKKRVTKEKSQFWYYKFKELSLHRILFQSIEKKQFAEDVRTTYKWYILPSLNTLSEIRDKLNFQESFLEAFKITKKFDNPENLPSYATYIQIRFILKKPYLSKDDDEFYIIDNPIVKDRVFKLPMVRATTWKGALRFAAIKVFEDWIYEKLTESKLEKRIVFRERAKIVKLFGNEKDSQEEYLGKLCLLAIEGKLPAGEKLKEEVVKINKEFEKWLIDEKIVSKDIPSRSGRLFFYPTFFDEISLDVITPLSRETRTPVRGRGPIYFEIAPDGAEGIFRLLYYPFDLVAKGMLDEIENEMKEDLNFLAKALQKMFYEIGFSAKKTSGFGVISEFNGNVLIPFKNINSNFKSFDELDFSKLCTKVNKNVNYGASK